MSNVVSKFVAVLVLIMSVGFAVLVITAPPDMSVALTMGIVIVPTGLAISMVLVGILYLLSRRLWRIWHISSTSDEIRLEFTRWHALEIIFVVLFALVVTRQYINFDDDYRVQGIEIEWLTGYGQVAHQGLRDTGVIPLWNPYYQQGEPLVDSSFSYLMYPFSSVPQLILGGTNGVKISVVVQAILVAVGGWFLGYVLGLSTMGRLTLALLLLGKGNMHTNFNAGYFQLASQQVYFPWVMAGAVSVIKTNDRWAKILLAVSMSMMFFAGNLWHLLPTVISIAGLILVYGWTGRRFNWQLVGRFVVVTLVTIGLCAVTLFSVVQNFDRIERHQDEARAGWEYNEPNLLYLFPFVGDYEFVYKDRMLTIPKSDDRTEDVDTLISWGISGHFYYSYVVPYWLVLLLVLPVSFILMHRERLPDNRRMWVAGIVLFVIFTMWGMGGTPLFLWLYDHVPYLAQWRFVPRALGMASFWTTVLVAMRLDAIIRLFWYRRGRYVYRLSLIIVSGYCVLAGLAWLDVNSRWSNSPLIKRDVEFASCLQWLGQAEPETFHTLRVVGYETMTALIENDIRMINIEADYLLNAQPITVGDTRLDFRHRLTHYRTLTFISELSLFEDLGYRPLRESPSYKYSDHCMYQNPDYALPYAFVTDSADWEAIDSEEDEFDKLTQQVLETLMVTPIDNVRRIYDHVVLYVQGTGELLVIQELAYPGWEVWIDDIQQPLEILGKLSAVRLPEDNEVHEVVFLYRPALVEVGGIVTTLTAILSMGYLLRIDRRIHRRLNQS